MIHVCPKILWSFIWSSESGANFCHSYNLNYEAKFQLVKQNVAFSAMCLISLYWYGLHQLIDEIDTRNLDSYLNSGVHWRHHKNEILNRLSWINTHLRRVKNKWPYLKRFPFSSLMSRVHVLFNLIFWQLTFSYFKLPSQLIQSSFLFIDVQLTIHHETSDHFNE